MLERAFSLLKKQQNEKSCTNKHKSKSFVHLFKGGGVEGWSPSSLSADSEIPLFQKNGARGEKCESISRGGVQDRLPFLHTQANLPSKTFRWNALDKATPPSFLYSLYKTDIFFDRLNALSTVLERVFLTHKKTAPTKVGAVQYSLNTALPPCGE